VIGCQFTRATRGATVAGMRACLVVVAILVSTSVARAGGLEPVNGVVDGAIADDDGRGIAGETVRLVSDSLVVIARTDARGEFHVTGLPRAEYRVEVARGWIREPFPKVTGLTITRDEYGYPFLHSCASAMVRRTFDVWPARTGHVDTASTAQGVRMTARDWF